MANLILQKEDVIVTKVIDSSDGKIRATITYKNNMAITLLAEHREKSESVSLDLRNEVLMTGLNILFDKE